MSIPVIGGAGFLQFLNVVESGSFKLELKIVLLGFFSAVISGYLAIKILLKVLAEKKLDYFSYYCWLAAAAVIIINFIS
jgi:undecaprenyl-diphosphatase